MTLTTDDLKARTLEGFEQMFNQGRADRVPEFIAAHGVDHQEPAGTEMVPHLQEVVVALREAFPDLHFEVHEILADGHIVACRSTMTGTHRGPLRLGPMAALPITGARVEVPHMHFFRYDEQGKVVDLWHVWNTLLLARQLGAPAPDLRVGVGA